MCLTNSQRIKILNQSNCRCFYCGKPIERKFEIDHFNPFSKSRDGTVDNLVASCIPCNKTKSDLSIDDFRAIVEKAKGEPIIFFFEYYGIVKKGGSCVYMNTLNEQMF